MRAARTACARVPSRSERTGAGGAIAASASSARATSGAASRKYRWRPWRSAVTQPAVDELGEVDAGRGRGHAGLGGQHAGGQLAPVGERAQHTRAAGIADQGAHAREIGVAGHDLTVAARRFVPETKRPATYGRAMPKRTLTLVVMCVGMFLVLLDVTIVNVALPRIHADLGASVASLQWIVDGYGIALAALMLPFGDLGDRRGHKRVVLAGLAVFGAGSLGAGLAPGAARADRRTHRAGHRRRVAAARHARGRLARVRAARRARPRDRHLGRDLGHRAARRRHRRRRARRGARMALGVSRQPPDRRRRVCRGAGDRARDARAVRAGSRSGWDRADRRPPGHDDLRDHRDLGDRGRRRDRPARRARGGRAPRRASRCCRPRSSAAARSPPRPCSRAR